MTPFSPRLLTITALLFAVLLNGAPNTKAQDAATGITAAQVNEAIARGVRYLKSQQRPDGTWEERALYAGGLTPLATLALIQAGCDPKDEAVAKALKHLRNFRPDATYTAALQTMVFCAAEPERDRLLIERNVKWLEDHQIRDGAQAGMWAIPKLGTPDHTDNSMTHMAMLALYDAERIGVSATDETWQLALNYWRREQNPDGSWGWGPDYPGTGSMTAAGIASVLAASERLEPSDARVQGDAISCCNQQTPNKTVDLGMSWLKRNFSVNRNPGVRGFEAFACGEDRGDAGGGHTAGAGVVGAPTPRAVGVLLAAPIVEGELPGFVSGGDADALGMSWLKRNFSVNRNPGVDYWHSYYMFALERVGRITAQRFIGDHDWYREGAELIVGMQLPDGSWPSDLDEEHLDDLRVSTSFYLMFLAKGRRPLVLAHLKHEPAGDWRRHRGALLHLVAAVEREWKLPLAHQVVDIGPATVEDLLQTPVLYISGHDAPQFTAEQKEKLRMYVDRGGFLFFDQSCLGGGFDAAVRELIAELFPNPDTKLRPLPPSHPIWRMERPVDPTTAPPFYGVEVSCRTAVVYVPDDLGCRWELLGRNRELGYPPAVRARVEQAETLGLNILAYATNREVGYKDPAVPTPEGDDDADDSRGTIRIANILHPGGCEGAPGALRNLLHLADHHLRIIIAVPQEVSLSSPTLFSNNFLMFHGRTAFKLTPAERKGLREFVERGGTVLADAICSSKEFTDSLRTELKETFPESPLAPIPADDPLFTTEYGGYDLAKVTRRRNSGGARDAENGGVASIESEEPPQLEAVTIDGRHVIIFSPHDLSCSLEGAAPQCEGYTRQDAARISLNVLLYAIH